MSVQRSLHLLVISKGWECQEKKGLCQKYFGSHRWGIPSEVGAVYYRGYRRSDPDSYLLERWICITGDGTCGGRQNDSEFYHLVKLALRSDFPWYDVNVTGKAI